MAVLAFDAKRAFHNTTGLGNYSRFILDGLVKFHGDDYRFLLMNPRATDYYAQRDSRLEEVLPEGIYKTFSSLWRSGAMWKDLRKQRVELFHGLSNELPSGLRNQGIRSVVTIHDLIFESHPQFYKPADRLIYRHKFKRAAQQANLVLSVSAFTKEQLVDRYGIHPNKIAVHYQSCHPAFHQSHPPQADAALLQNLQLPAQYALSVGTIEERKNLLNTLKALQSIDLPLVVVGRGGKYADACKTFVAQSKMDNRVQWIESISPEVLAALYRKASLFLYPSRVEGFGIPIIEALFSACPVITTQAGVFPEAGGPDSWYADPENPETIGHAIRDILEHPEQARKRAMQGLSYAHSHFLPEPLIHQLHQHYQTVLKQPL